ncbi:MAG TPA: hypothetical protein VLD16_06985 [Gaiellaceae bacterium]|nr:hypothetical protein [Gaiellaceae bacterium]
MAGAGAAVGAAGATAEAAERAGAPLLVEAREQALLIAGLRLVLALAGVVAAVAFGVDRGAALGLLAVGAFALLLAVYGGDRRRRSALKFAEPQPVPADARFAGKARTLAHVAYPSTIGLTALIAVALWPQPGLAALLAGLLAGLAAMSLVGLARLALWEDERRTRFYVDPHTDTVFEAPR